MRHLQHLAMPAVMIAILLYSITASQAATSFSDEQICKAGIATLMGRSPTIIKTTGKEGNVVFFHYVRPTDGSKWSYRCKVEGIRIIWASDTGRWRTHSDDERITYRASGDTLEIIQTFTDGSSVNKQFTRQQLGGIK